MNASGENLPDPSPDKRAIVSWAFYDFANTIFSMNVISLYFALWVTVDHGGQDILYSAALSGSMLAVAESVVNNRGPQTSIPSGPGSFLVLRVRNPWSLSQMASWAEVAAPVA